MNILLTAFGPFQNFEINPSQIVLEEIASDSNLQLDIDFKVIDVSFDAVDDFIENLNKPYSLIIHMGVATGESKTRLEVLAKNIAHGQDVNEKVYKKKYINEESHDLLTTVPNKVIDALVDKYKDELYISNDAGNYLCNYIYYKSIFKFGKLTPVLFIHISDFQNIEHANNVIIQSGIVKNLIKEFEKYEQQKTSIV